jgi:uncharacterized protein YbaA (DUF1428 family)
MIPARPSDTLRFCTDAGTPPRRELSRPARVADVIQPGAMPFDGKRRCRGGFEMAMRI